MTEHTLSPETDLRATMWYNAVLEPLCRPGAQTDLYRFVHELLAEDENSASPIVLNCHRRLGKSFLMLLLLYERCLSKPGQQCIYGAPSYEQVAKIVMPNVAILEQTMPDKLRPKVSGYKRTFHNHLWGKDALPSTLFIVGCDYKDGNHLRGTAADAIAFDECREMAKLRYLVEDVFLFQFVGRKSPFVILASTPPASGDHEFSSYFIHRAIQDNRYRVFPTTANPDWDERDEAMLMKQYGSSKTSISWRREALCELVADEDELVVPEFQANKEKIVVETYPRPPRFVPMTVLDTGWVDWNAVLYGYVDFEKQILVIEDEHVLRYESTGNIAGKIKVRERQLWLDKTADNWVGGYPVRRVGDLTKQALEDLRIDCSLFVRPVEKWDRNAAIATMRCGFEDGRVRIFKRCKNLIYQLENGLWDERRKAFQRSKTLGHCDALAAMVYFYRMAPWSVNPLKGGKPLPQDWFGGPPKHRSDFDGLLKVLGRDGEIEKTRRIS